MPITVKDLRELIAGLNDDVEVGLTEHSGDVDEAIYAELEGAKLGDDGSLRIIVRIGNHDDDEFGDWGDDDEDII